MREVIVGVGEYKGSPTLHIEWADDDRFPFSFGVAKAKMLMQALKQEPDLLATFIKEHA